MKIIFDYNRTLYDPETESLYPNVLSILSSLSENHELFLVSRMEPSRESVLVDLGINDFFKQKIFVNHKTTDLFKSLLNNEEKAIVIGDRIKGEILIGNQLGCTTIWVRQGKFMNELPTTEEEQPNHTIENINQLYELIKKYE